MTLKGFFDIVSILTVIISSNSSLTAMIDIQEKKPPSLKTLLAMPDYEAKKELDTAAQCKKRLEEITQASEILVYLKKYETGETIFKTFDIHKKILDENVKFAEEYVKPRAKDLIDYVTQEKILEALRKAFQALEKLEEEHKALGKTFGAIKLRFELLLKDYGELTSKYFPTKELEDFKDLTLVNLGKRIGKTNQDPSSYQNQELVSSLGDELAKAEKAYKELANVAKLEKKVVRLIQESSPRNSKVEEKVSTPESSSPRAKASSSPPTAKKGRSATVGPNSPKTPIASGIGFSEDVQREYKEKMVKMRNRSHTISSSNKNGGE